MANATSADKSHSTTPDKLKYYHHPFTDTFYGAYGPDRVRVTRGDQWGEFNRDGHWLEGEIRFADPTFCHWVTGEHRYNARLLAAKQKVWPLTRLGRTNKVA